MTRPSPSTTFFPAGGKRLACLTDTGYVSEEVEYEIQDADAYLLEFNYDDLMLRSGPYPWSLQQRVRSDHGHLSNEQAAETLARVISSKTKHVFMAHRSQQNNFKLFGPGRGGRGFGGQRRRRGQ